ncbi:MAG: LysR family transcriptional regulator [Sulfitobacter sp.]|nr:LysR family transcriptional regulator [Sulfitobacter sp.]
MSLIPSLEHIPAFHAVMTQGSLSAAARTLGLAQPTVRRHVEALEAELETQLFTRAANGLTPTEMAEALFPMALSVLEEAAALGRMAQGAKDRLEGVVRLTASRVVATHVLPPVLAEIRRGAPDLRFELAATDRPENLARRAADIAIRFTEPKQFALRAQRLPDVEVGLFTAPDGPTPRTLEGLADVPFIADDREGLILPQLEAAGLPRLSNVVLRCDDPMAQIAHLQAGLGVGVCQVRLAHRLGLKRVLPDLSYTMPAWLVVHEDQARLKRIRHVFDALRTALPTWM